MYVEFIVLLCLLSSCYVNAKTFLFSELGGIANDNSLSAANKNGFIFNSTLQGGLSNGDTLVFDKDLVFYTQGGIYGANLAGITLQFDGELRFSDNITEWPLGAAGRVLECLHLVNMTDLLITSDTQTGLLNGQGKNWWGFPGIGYLVRGENRPRLMNIETSTNVVVEHIWMKDSPYWTFWCHGVEGLVVRYCNITAARTNSTTHDPIDMTAFNTDGFDVTGNNVHIHDCEVWNQDDCIAVKDESTNMLFERITASGVGLTVGSISGSVVKNITFRDCTMHNSYKGIYLKFRDGTVPGSVTDVLYENIVMEAPEQWAIWIGPAQQSDSVNLCAAHPCSICWPTIPMAECNMPVVGTYDGITLRNITINNPKTSPGVIFGNSDNPIKNLVLDNVVVSNPGSKPWGDDYYYCHGVDVNTLSVLGDTWPKPKCTLNMTDTLY